MEAIASLVLVPVLVLVLVLVLAAAHRVLLRRSKGKVAHDARCDSLVLAN